MYWTLGCIYGASAVAFGAFGAHGLKKRIADPGRLANFATAAHYQVRTSGLDCDVASLEEMYESSGIMTELL